MAARSLRCVAIAYRDYELDKIPNEEEELSQWALPEDELVLLAIVGIKVCLQSTNILLLCMVHQFCAVLSSQFHLSIGKLVEFPCGLQRVTAHGDTIEKIGSVLGLVLCFLRFCWGWNLSKVTKISFDIQHTTLWI